MKRPLQIISQKLVEKISREKNEPEWMLKLRLKALEKFNFMQMPKFGPGLNEIDFSELEYFVKAGSKEATSWEQVPEYIKKTFERLGIPEAEKRYLAGASAQYESEVVYHNIKEELQKQGVVFSSMDEALKKHENIVKKFFGKLVPYWDNKFAALNTAFWSGGSFVYVPKNVALERPIQAYFSIFTQGMGQFERTLIIAEENSRAHYIEGCTAPLYRKSSIHAAVVEVFAMKNSSLRYTTVQNWSKNIYNLVTKRSIAYENAYIEWLDGNMGSKITMKYPCIILAGKNSKGKIISIAYANEGQIIDSGAKIIHNAEKTSSSIVSKGISANSGRTNYRGLVSIGKNAENSKASVSCDALLLDEKSVTSTYPEISNQNNSSEISHEASIGKISEEQLFYLQSRCIKKENAKSMVVLGFLNEFAKELPLEHAVELNKLIAMDMEESIA